MALRNLPYLEPFDLASLVRAAPGQVASRTLASEVPSATLVAMALSAGESVSETTYESDTLYAPIAGTLEVSVRGESLSVDPGQGLAVAAGTPHAVAGTQGDAQGGTQGDAVTFIQLEL